MRQLFNTKLARWVFNRLYQIPMGATIVQLSRNSIHYTEDGQTFKCKVFQIDLLDFPIFRKVRGFFLLPLGYISKGFAFLLLTDNTATNNKDTHIISPSPTTNDGTSVGMWANSGSGNNYRSLIHFTLPSGSGTISDIKLFLYKGANLGTTLVSMEVHELSRTDWTETGATWNNYKAGSAWTTAGGDFSATVVDSFVKSNSVNLWREWGLYGATSTNPMSITWGSEVHLVVTPSALSSSPDQGENYNTKEAASNKPYIEITYTAGGGTTPPPVFFIFN